MTEKPIEWTTIRLAVEAAQVDSAETALFECGAQAVTLLDAEDHPVHEPAPGERLLWPTVMVEALFDQPPPAAGLVAALNAAGLLIDGAALHSTQLAERDWIRAWMDSYRPMRFGQGLWICPSHIEPDPDWPRVIRLDPGLAFGSGTHPTTALCLAWLDDQTLAGRTVIDYGCGSGVLAIAAGLLGAERIIAVDHDPQALTATEDNARRNGVGDLIDTCLPEDFQPQPVDLVLANILAGPLIELSDRLIACLDKRARLVLSGLLADQAESVTAAYRGRLGEPEIGQQEGWLRLVFGHDHQASGGGP